MTSISESAAPC